MAEEVSERSLDRSEHGLGLKGVAKNERSVSSSTSRVGRDGKIHDLRRVSQNRPSERSKKFTNDGDELEIDVGVRDGSGSS